MSAPTKPNQLTQLPEGFLITRCEPRRSPGARKRLVLPKGRMLSAGLAEAAYEADGKESKTNNARRRAQAEGK